MKRYTNSFSLFLSALILTGALFLSGCETGGRFGDLQPWPSSQVEEPLPTKAEAPPDQLAALETEETDTDITQEPLEAEQAAPVYKEAAPAVPEVTIALLAPLSGPHQHIGEALNNAAQMALFEVGHEGLNMLPLDTRGTRDGAQEAMAQAREAGASLIIGPLLSQSTEAIKPAARAANIPVISFSTDWSVAGNGTYTMGFLPFDQIERLADYAARQGVRNVVILEPSNDYGRIVTQVWQRSANARGINTVRAFRFSPSSNNLSPVIRSLAEFGGIDSGDDNPLASIRKAGMSENAAQFDAVLMPVGGTAAITLANLMSNYGMSPSRVRRLGTGLFDDPSLAVERNLQGAWFAGPPQKLKREFTQRYREIYGMSPPQLASLAYDATALASVLSRQDQGFSPRSIMNPNGFAGIDGIFRFRRDGTVERGLSVLGFQSRSIRTIERAPDTFESRY